MEDKFPIKLEYTVPKTHGIVYITQSVKGSIWKYYLFPQIASPPIQHSRQYSKDSARILTQYRSELIRKKITAMSLYTNEKISYSSNQELVITKYKHDKEKLYNGSGWHQWFNWMMKNWKLVIYVIECCINQKLLHS